MTAQASLERLRASPLPRVLFLAHGFGGGVERHIESLASAIAPHAEALLLQPHVEGFLALRWLRGGERLEIWFRAPQDWDRALLLLASLGIDRVHYHHVHGLPPSVLRLPERLQCPWDVTLHDYFAACPAYHLNGGGRFCGGEPTCEHCLDGGPGEWPLTIAQWRSAFGELLAGAQRVIAPSTDAAGRIRRFFPAISPVVWPHAEDAAESVVTPVRVLVPGALSAAKGLDVLEACVRDAAARSLPLHFRALGYTARPIPAWPALPFSVSGEYREADLGRLIALERGDVFFFPAQVPETFSYTLSAALATALPIVATDLGAFPERLAARANARIVAWDTPAARMNDAILSFAPMLEQRPPVEAAMTPARYAALYLEGLRRGAGVPASVPDLDPRWSEEPRGSPTPSSLAWLFGDAIACGRGKSLDELARRVGEADAAVQEAAVAASELARFRAEISEREAAVRALDAQLGAAHAELQRRTDELRSLEARLRRIEESRSWRLTAPLRALVRRLRSEP